MRTALAVPLRIVVTGAGAPGIRGTLFSLKDNPDSNPVYLIGTDMKSDCVGRHFVHEFAVLPAPEDRAYVGTLLEVARRAGAHVVLPRRRGRCWRCPESWTTSPRKGSPSRFPVLPTRSWRTASGASSRSAKRLVSPPPRDALNLGG